MKYIAHHIAFLLVALLLISPFSFQVPRAEAAVGNWQKGASVQPTKSNTEFGTDDMKRSLDKLKATNANYVSLIIPLYQSNNGSTDIHSGWNTPTDDSLIAAIRYAHSIGLKVTLKPHLETYNDGWRAMINPGDRAGWFANYGAKLEHYARIGAQNGVEDIILGTELISMTVPWTSSSNTENWNKMIDRIKAVYSGKLSYSANWSGGEAENIGFWGKLDYIGLSAYFNLDQGGNNSNSVEGLKSSWDYWNRNSIKPLYDRFQKPIIFTEIGYRSVDGAYRHPWEWSNWGSFNEQEQANLYEALMSYWNGQSFMQGVHLWDWASNPNAGGAGDTSYTPQNKKAEGIMKTWFGSAPSGSTTPPPSGAPQTPGTFTSSASASPAAPAVGQGTTIGATVTGSNSQITNGITDIEIYDSSNQQIFQKIYDSQNYSSPKSYSFGWTPSTAGQYSVKIGVFGANWSSIHYWNDKALTFTVGSGASTPPPVSTPPPSGGTVSTPGAIEIWWPTQSTTVGGVTPFKAMLQNSEVSSYTMQWQVDGDRLNAMYNSQEDYPHKEALVDLTGWNWKGTGPYKINFKATNPGGSLITEKSVDISVAN